MKVIISAFFALVLLSGCAGYHESVMPFRNLAVTGSSLFPVSKNDTEFTLRIWVNFSTNIDRVFTVSSSKEFGYQGKLLEIRSGQNKNGKDNTTFKQINITPLSGFDRFIAMVDSMKLLNVADQQEAEFAPALHQPFSHYVIEIRSKGRANQFEFNTYYPGEAPVGDKYQAIQQLLFDEFKFNFYF